MLPFLDCTRAWLKPSRFNLRWDFHRYAKQIQYKTPWVYRLSLWTIDWSWKKFKLLLQPVDSPVKKVLIDCTDVKRIETYTHRHQTRNNFRETANTTVMITHPAAVGGTLAASCYLINYFSQSHCHYLDSSCFLWPLVL